MAHFFNHLTTAVRSTGILDLGAMGSFLKNGVGIPTGKPSGKTVGMPNGLIKKSTQQVQLLTTKLSEEAEAGDELPSLQKHFFSILILANNGYTMVFCPGDKGVEVYHSEDVEILP